MNYLIVCPKFVESKSDYYPFPVGIAYINASLKLVRNTVYQLNLNYKQNIFKALKEKIINNKIDCIAIGGTSLMYNHINEVMKYAKQIKPDIITIVGGGLITAAPEVAMKGLTATDIGVIGEGEYTIRELADVLENGADLSQVDGIIYRRLNGELVKTKERGDIQDLDALPFPDYDGFDYERGHDDFDESIISHNKFLIEKSICASRSCPYNCTFCFHTCGKSYRMRSLDNIFKEIDWLVEKYNIKYLMIADELFVCYKDRVMEFCDRIKKYNIKWRTSARVDTISPEILAKLKESGCYQVGFGIESASNEILKGMKKHITIEQIEYAFEQSRKANLQTVGGFLFGDKNETFDSFKRTLDYWEKHDSYDLGCYRVIVLPGSELYKYALENGYIKDELKYWEAGFPYFNLTKMSDDEYLTCLYMMDDILARKIYYPEQYRLLNIDLDNKIIDMEVICKSCGNTYTVQENEFTGDYIFSYYCPNCGQLHCTPAYNLVKDLIDNALKQYLRNNKLFIYGIGRSVRRFIYLCKVMQDENVFLIDADPLKQKLGVYGKKILPPIAIEKMKVTEIINGATMVAQIALINEVICKNYKNVHKIKNFNDFLFDLIKEK